MLLLDRSPDAVWGSVKATSRYLNVLWHLVTVLQPEDVEPGKTNKFPGEAGRTQMIKLGQVTYQVLQDLESCEQDGSLRPWSCTYEPFAPPIAPAGCDLDDPQLLAKVDVLEELALHQALCEGESLKTQILCHRECCCNFCTYLNIICSIEIRCWAT